MPDKQAKRLIVAIFREVVLPPTLDMGAVERYISRDYVQTVDGVTLDYAGFVEHMGKQKQVLASLTVDFLAMAEEGETVFSNHIVSATKKDGSQVRVKVIAQFVVRNGLLSRCDELTRLLSGNEADRGLGSIR